MRKYLVTGIAIVAALGTFAFMRNTASAVITETPAEIHWYTLEEAQKLSDANPRKIFVDFTTSWCGWCKTMDANTFKNPTIAKYMNANYYCVKFNAETRDTVTFNGQKFWNRGAPNQRSANDFAITALQGRLQGYQAPEAFEPYIHYYAEEKEKTMTYDAFLKTFKSELPAAAPAKQTPAPGGH
jgi:thioredoxin-related protein